MIKNLKKLRNQYGISQQHLANAVGVSQQSINKYENHKSEPDIETLKAIAVFLTLLSIISSALTKAKQCLTKKANF